MNSSLPKQMPALLFADANGKVYEHPVFRAAIWNGRDFLPAAARDFVPLGLDGELLLLPGRLPLAWDPDLHSAKVVRKIKLGTREIQPMAVAAVPEMGWTRTCLPAFERQPCAPDLPLYAYTAAAALNGQISVAAILTDKHTHWHGAHFNTSDLPQLIQQHLAEFPGNSVLEQLARCSLEYRCRTAQNIFFRRWEGGLPVSPACNARCVGCISSQPKDSPTCSAQHRLSVVPELADIVEVATAHLLNAKQPMISFGQGCEGEPTMHAALIEKAIREVRRRTKRGFFHLNTNGSKPDAVQRLAKAGLQSIRIALNSAQPAWYKAYFRPRGYNFENVRESIRIASRLGLNTSINLLVFPGITDQLEEADALCKLLAETRPHSLQLRSLCLDPEHYLACLPKTANTGSCMGMRSFIHQIKKRCTWLKIANFNLLP